MMKKMLVFDMDGTIADFYGVNGWLEMITNSIVTPYIEANPIYDPVCLNSILNALKKDGWKIMVTTWLSKDSTAEYEKAVTQAKIEWLKKYEFPFDNVFCVPYGTQKQTVTKKFGGYQILIDDNKEVREKWDNGDTINANDNILAELVKLIRID